MPFRLFSDALFNTLFISPAVTTFLRTHVKSVSEPSGVGTLSATPSIFPLSSGMTRDTALAAPVVVGIIETAAALARLRSLCGK
jgi:hypothetical protein